MFLVSVYKTGKWENCVGFTYVMFVLTGGTVRGGYTVSSSVSGREEYTFDSPEGLGCTGPAFCILHSTHKDV